MFMHILNCFNYRNFKFLQKKSIQELPFSLDFILKLGSQDFVV